MKYMKKILISISLILILIITGCKSKTPDKHISLNKNTELIEINKKGDLEKIVDGYIFFSSKDCPLCSEITPLVKDEINGNNYNIYYFDIFNMMYKEIYTSKELQKICNDYYIALVPTILKLKNGTEVDRFPSDYDKKLSELSKELKKFLKED